MSRPTVRHVLLAVTVVLGTFGVVGALHTGDLPGHGDSWALALVAIGNAGLGWLVIGRRPELSIGWMILAGGLVGAVVFVSSWWALEALVADPGSLPAPGLAVWVALSLSPVQPLIALVMPVATVPDGVPRSRRWRRFLVAVTVVVASLMVAVAVIAAPVAIDRPGELVDDPNVASGPRADWALVLEATARTIVFAAMVVSLVGVAVTRRRSVGERRRQLSIVLVGAAGFVVTNVAIGFVEPLSAQRLEPPEVVAALSWLAIPGAITVAVVRNGLYELRVFLNRSAMAVAVGAALAAVYFVVLFGAAALLDETVSLSAANLLAAGAVAIICVPVVSGARRRVSRWLGRATTPHTFAERLRDVSSDQPALQELATMVAQELRLGSVRLTVEALPPTHVGVPHGPEHHLELRRGATSVGEMVVCARRGESLAATDLRTLGEVAQFVAVAVDAIRVNDQLRVSQAALARAHGEERRRVRRDLHDGLGPTLASIRLRLARRRHATINPEALDEIFEQVTDAIREVRRIVDGLQPSMLEDLGLVPALQILVNDTRDATALDITFESTGMTPELPADIAATAYRSVAEALANVTRHSHATACTVHLTMAPEDLRVEITDNGNGFQPTAAAAGMGLRSLQNRAAALGGTIAIASQVGEGTCVAVRLPT